ncbi:hypothetical protein [Flectobacillus major]|uniref:hypothetical protein n=1 Tax=Flectobacillus major TaxID=103 RepID=UPI000421E1E0|nr:hypothetical protein [Flectobacillus major]
MKLLMLYIQITPSLETVRFQNPLLGYLSNNITDFTVYDVDNHSEGLVIEYAKRLIREAENIIVLLDAQASGQLKGVTNLLTQLADKSENTSVVYQGEHEGLKKMISIFTHIYNIGNTYDLDEIARILDKIYPK